MMRRLEPGDFAALWALASPCIDYRLKPDMDRAREGYKHVLSQATNFAVGEFVDGKLVGAVMVSSCPFLYAQKGFASVDMWVGRLALLDLAIEWWRARPGLRALSLQFPSNVRPGLYKFLARRGFERKGDMNFAWR